jgi:hypothetical protein
VGFQEETTKQKDIMKVTPKPIAEYFKVKPGHKLLILENIDDPSPANLLLWEKAALDIGEYETAKYFRDAHNKQISSSDPLL